MTLMSGCIGRSNHDLRALRQRLMRGRERFPAEIVASANGTESHSFLTNPAIQFIYRYLTRFVVEASSVHFEREPSELRILDWGCGKGHITLLLRELGVLPLSCDMVTEKDDSAFGQSTPLVTEFGIAVVPLTDEELLPFPDASFDAVVSMGVLEHVRNDAGSLREIHRTLRPGGLFFCFFLPSTLAWTQRLAHLRGDYYHERFYSRRKISALARAAHLQVLGSWRRQLFPKNDVRYIAPGIWESLDQFLCAWTPLGWFATNLEFVARKPD